MIFYFKTFWQNYILDLRSYGQLFSLFYECLNLMVLSKKSLKFHYPFKNLFNVAAGILKFSTLFEILSYYNYDEKSNLVDIQK